MSRAQVPAPLTKKAERGRRLRPRLAPRAHHKDSSAERGPQNTRPAAVPPESAPSTHETKVSVLPRPYTQAPGSGTKQERLVTGKKLAKSK